MSKELTSSLSSKEMDHLMQKKAENSKGLIFSLVAPGPFPASEQTFEQSHSPLTIISSIPNFFVLFIKQKNLSSNCLTADN